MVNIRYKTVDSTWIYVNSFDKISNDAIELDCSGKLPELINLKSIDCSSNKLTKLPEFKIDRL